ncbi:MAG: N-acetylmuramoyl-L-alanine amidase [Candidatus Saccharibacteria bacterium]|nr:N-acetylmuramoyl-L-alanine amidase [Moraxellaceae bacterium]
MLNSWMLHWRKIFLFLLTSLAIQQANAEYIAVDTGHTPLHPGATGANGRVEYLYNLSVTDALAQDLVARGDRVSRTSADGKEISLQERSANAPDADLFISIHHDSILQEWIDAGRSKEFSGYSIFVSKKNTHYEQSLNCAQKIGEQMLMIGENPSLYHAIPVQGENRLLIDQYFGVHQYDDLIVLKTAPMPAVLVEIGVIANPDEEARLSKPEVVQRVSHAIATGIHACSMTKNLK